MRGANPPLPYPALTLLTLSDPKPTLPFPRGTFAALETAFGMGERRDVWYNMRMKGSVKTTQVESPRQEDDVRGGLLLK